MNAEQMRARTGMTLRQLTYWQQQGWLAPINPKPGTGYSLEFSGDQVRIADTMVRLVRAGLTPRVAHRVACGRNELAPGVFILVDASADVEQRVIDREVLLMTRRIYRSPKARRLRALRAASKAGASR